MECKWITPAKKCIVPIYLNYARLQVDQGGFLRLRTGLSNIRTGLKVEYGGLQVDKSKMSRLLVEYSVWQADYSELLEFWITADQKEISPY